MPKVSVIVPVYNGADHLRKEVSGLLKQTLDDIEIIFVNDASTDDTWKVLQAIKYMQPDRCRIINSDRNRGAGGARNIGILAATGDYIGFVDCDDSVAPTMYEKLYNEAVRGDYDMVECAYRDMHMDSINVFTAEDMVGEVDTETRNVWICIGGYLVTKIFKRELFKDQRTVFRENTSVEDLDVLVYLYATIRSAGNVMEALYMYNNVPESYSHVPDFKKNIASLYEVIRSIYDKVHDLPVYPDIRLAVEALITVHYMYAVKRCLYEIQKRREFKIKNSYSNNTIISELSRLKLLKSKIVQTDFRNNDFIVNRMNDVNLNILKALEESNYGSLKRVVNKLSEKYHFSYNQ